MSQITVSKLSPFAYRKKYAASQRPAIRELMLKYECPNTTANDDFKTPKLKSPKMSDKSRVKEMAFMFNNKISQMVRPDATDAKNYNKLVNEFSSEAKPLSKATWSKPLPLPRIRYVKGKAPVPSPRTTSKTKTQQETSGFVAENVFAKSAVKEQKTSCFVAEDVFAKLTVKEKVSLYTQFIGDMSKKNPQIGEHDELMGANVKKRFAHGEVVTEKQESVKRLLEELEARCTFPRQTISPAAMERIKCMLQTTTKSGPAAVPVKSKEFEDIVESPKPHISTLTVTLQRNPEIKRQRRAHSLPRHKTEGGQVREELGAVESSHKRNKDEMRSTLSDEAYAPPKKIRRSKAEHLISKFFFQNQQLETLFYSWLKERHDNAVAQPENLQNSDIDMGKEKSILKLLEEAMARLNNGEIEQNQEQEPTLEGECVHTHTQPTLEGEEKVDTTIKAETLGTKTMEDIQAKSLHIVKPETVTATNLEQENPKPMVSSESSTTSSIASSLKHSDAEESESGVSLLPKITSDESRPESITKSDTVAPADFQFAKSLAPIRKRKMRRNSICKKNTTVLTINLNTTTDSELEGKESKLIQQKSVTKSQLSNTNDPIIGTTFDINLKEMTKSLEILVNDMDINLPATVAPSEPTLVELGKSSIKEVNSTSSIMSVFSLPPPYNEDDLQQTDSFETKGHDSFDSVPVSENQTSAKLQEDKKRVEPSSLADSFDQGFETGSNDVDSPIRAPKKLCARSAYSPLFIKLDDEPQGFSNEFRLFNGTEYPDWSYTQQNDSRSGAQQQLFNSCIAKPYINRRRSIYDNESTRSSLLMQVIREDHPLENHEILAPITFNKTAAEAPTMVITDTTGVDTQKTSSYWIKAGDFSISLDIFYNDADRVKLLYNVFCQRSYDVRDLHFGIDDHKFSMHNAIDRESISKRLPHSNDNSHYWFSTGDLAIPFSGKRLTSEKIQRLFKFIKVAVEENGILRFGVDDIEFSKVSEMWLEAPKFSLESAYSMLVGLQSGNSNGLEGRGKFAWPYSKPVPVSDFDNTRNECNDFEVNGTERYSLFSFGNNNFDLTSLTNEDSVLPSNIEPVNSFNSFYTRFENEPLDHLFADKHQQGHQKSELIPAVPEMLRTLQQQQERLSSVSERLSVYNNPAELSSDALEALKGTPEYLKQLEKIISDITFIGCTKGFKDCTAEQLERYMLFLSRYAGIWLNTCSDQMNKILDALTKNKSMAA